CSPRWSSSQPCVPSIDLADSATRARPIGRSTNACPRSITSMHMSSTPFPPLLVPVNDVETAIDFYCRAFDAKVVAPEGVAPAPSSQNRYVDCGGEFLLRIVDETTCDPDHPAMTGKGKTPRLEFRVDDVDEWVDRAQREAAVVRVRLALGHNRTLRKPAE